MKIVDKHYTFEKRDLPASALRDNNKLRPYLICNKLLAKHIPISPNKALAYFACLGEQVAAICRDERVLVIGFAETATAVGAAVAEAVGKTGASCNYVHTTREALPAMNDEQSGVCVRFFEEHSHAVNQALCFGGSLRDFDHVVFVEDEITTGKTILNFLAALEPFGVKELRVSIAALILRDGDFALFKPYHAEMICLSIVEGSVDLPDVPTRAAEDLRDVPVVCEPQMLHLHLPLGMNPRFGVNAGDYAAGCRAFASEAVSLLTFSHSQNDGGENERVLVLGTEECMYPALMLGAALETCDRQVRCHATTRSPILIGSEGDYPIRSGYKLQSLYDRERATFIYNLGAYDRAIILTDSPDKESGGLAQLCAALQKHGTNGIVCINLAGDR